MTGKALDPRRRTASGWFAAASPSLPPAVCESRLVELDPSTREIAIMSTKFVPFGRLSDGRFAHPL